MISIHALREEGDECPDVLPVAFLISIHALREEGDLARFEFTCPVCKFLSTPSARRATPSGFLDAVNAEFLSTPSARRATYGRDRLARLKQFLSTPSARRATSARSSW